MAAKKKKDTTTMDVLELTVKTLEVNIVGTSPLIFNAMSEKVRKEILFPSQKKSRAEKENTLKHDPVAEYRASVYRETGEDAETRLILPGGGVKSCIMQAGVDVPGAAKAALGRLVQVVETTVPVWGVPQLHMAVVRMAGQSRAPDIRTRAILPQWCARFHVRFVTPNLNAETVARLIAASGMLVGLGDYRPEKGKGSFGQFRIADAEEDAEVARIKKMGGREAQDTGLENPTPFDHETEALLEFFNAEVKRRGFKVAS